MESADRTTLLLAAAKAGDLEQVRELVDSGAGVDSAGRWDLTPLAVAAKNSHLDVVQFLVERGADIVTANHEARTPLTYATAGGHLGVVRYLIDHGADVNADRSCGWAPVMSAAVHGHLGIVKYLVDCGADVNKPDHDGQTPLLWAAMNGYLDTVQYLVSRGAEVDATDIDGDTPLIAAAAEGHLDVVRYLVSCGADVNATECEGWTPTTRAAARGHLDVVRYLIDCGGDANAPTDSGFTPLMSAALHERFEIVHFLHELGGDVHAADGNGQTALSWAAGSGHLGIVQFLVDRGARVNQADTYQRTPLMRAAISGHVDVVHYLADRGGDVNTCNNEKQTPLTSAATHGHLDVVRFLAHRGVAVNAAGEKGWTPVMCAAMRGHLDIVQCLVRRGADINADDDEGRTAATWAAMHGHLDVVRYLDDHGAIVNWDSGAGRTSMVLAAADGHIGVIKYFSGSSSDTKMHDPDGRTMLVAAATNGRLDIAKLLIDQGADVNLADTAGRTPLMCAATRGHLAVVRHLVDHDADVNTADSAGSTPLICAAKGGHMDVALLFIDCGANVNVADCKGWTPLMYAAKRGLSDLVQHIIESGAHVDVAKNDGKTALTCAASEGQLDAVQALIDRGANVNAADNGRLTPLICAVKGGHMNCVMHLVGCGADPNMATQGGESAIFFAAKYDYQDIHRLLLRHIDRARAAVSGREPVDSSPSSKPSKWFASPFEVELHKYVETGNVGGEYRATWLDTDVAIKLFTPDASNSTFAEEVSLWHQLRHPNVIKLYEVCDTGHHFFVCEYASNGTVVDYLNACKPEAWMPWKYLHQAALGLAYLHERKIIHGNLRGSNILVGSDGLAKLAGFGWSGSTRVSGSTATQVLVGSTRWQAPERVHGGAASFASDIYSLGLCVVEIVTGKIPWGWGDDRHIAIQKGEWDPDSDDTIMRVLGPAPFPWSLRDLIRRTCSRDPTRRATALSIVRMLERLAAQEESRNDAPQPEPEPQIDLSTFRDGETMRLWDEIERLMQTSTTIGLQQHVFQELETIGGRLKQSCQPRKPLQRYHDLLVDFHGAIQADSIANRILRLSSTRATGHSMLAYQHRIRDLWTMLGGSDDTAGKLEPQASEQDKNHLEVFVSEISKTWLVLSELESDEDRQAFLTLLKSEIEVHASSYTPGQLEIMQQAHDDINKVIGASVEMTTPAWFVPWYELSEWKWLTEGGFGSVYRAKWLDSEVLVKQMKRSDAEDPDKWSGASSSPWYSLGRASMTNGTTTAATATAKREEARKIFQREVDIWFHLSHPHVVRLFGACHVGNPFFVCEFAPHGSLDKYLRQHPDQIWQKLHEAALGIQYLHERGIVHGDLKCNNIVVGRDWKAKVTDFGLSSAISADEDAESAPVTGAWHWVAPECLAGESTTPTFASDVFALGMCVVEALRVVEAAQSDKSGRNSFRLPPPLPWGSLENPEVKYYVTHGELPLRPRECAASHWSLVEKMCRFNPSGRIKICTVVDELSTMAKDGRASSGRTGSNSIEPPESVLQVISETNELICGQLREDVAAPDSRHILYRVHKLLWERLSHLSGLLDDELLGSESFRLLIESAKAGTADVDRCSGALAQFTEMALHGYALHRRLDKFIAANFVKTDGDGDGRGVHAWQSKCYAFLGVTTVEEAPSSGHGAVQCA